MEGSFFNESTIFYYIIGSGFILDFTSFKGSLFVGFIVLDIISGLIYTVGSSYFVEGKFIVGSITGDLAVIIYSFKSSYLLVEGKLI